MDVLILFQQYLSSICQLLFMNPFIMLRTITEPSD